MSGYRLPNLIAATAALASVTCIVVPGALAPAWTQPATTVDPVGALTKTATFDRARKIEIGRSDRGLTACYFREEGSSHRLDIGITAAGAFIRLEAPDEREATPTAPLRVFAGKETGNGDWLTIRAFEGDVDYATPRPTTTDFTLTARSNPQAFLEMVAAARNEFVVVQSQADPKAVNVVAIYHFSAEAIPALLACAKDRLATKSDANAPAATPAAGAPRWTSYANARFGTIVDYPADIFSVIDPPPENNDGRRFHSSDGRAELSIYASYNAMDNTPKSYLEEYVDHQGATYKQVTANFFAVSGKRGNDIYYQRCNFIRDTVHCMSLNYPADQASTYDAIVTRISKSLRAGQTSTE
ncbi:MAG: hypothetical protein HXX15_18835 [Rhodopseudomonas sp.]|uniref:hypothetical protein n=1 Tax=Rhodopseudomonas sp. TaxID=1078 RepID=UPI0017B0F8D0|nr:hypothetical protein [Rhodopseudomonas sp.]NVN88141.1 hypothetical protein [Rhodopseudomonas sp.]